MNKTITYNGHEYYWTISLNSEVEVPLFEAFKSGKSVKSFLVYPEHRNMSARIIARLEKETAERDVDKNITKAYLYSEENLSELTLTRDDIKNAERLKPISPQVPKNNGITQEDHKRLEDLMKEENKRGKS